VLDVEGLAKRLSSAVVAREYLEARHNLVEDEGLVGLLNLTCTVMKHNPPFKTRQEGQDFMLQVCILYPNEMYKNTINVFILHRCLSSCLRCQVLDRDCYLSVSHRLQGPRPMICSWNSLSVLQTTIECYMNVFLLSIHQVRHIYLCEELLLPVLITDQESPYPWDYWPHEDGRSDCGYVGLTNLGATCYMASCMQHLYMMPQARAAILQARCDASSKHEQTLRELQRMFAYLLVSSF
jgi:ubiquitin carboxyl-terminal hydrolase 34